MSEKFPLVVPLSKWQSSERYSQDANPVLIAEAVAKRDTASSSAEDDKTSLACAVCLQHEYRYHCPRCQLPYCSVECYRNHTTTSNDSSTASDCTEGFYKNRVSSILQLEAKEQQEATRKILNRQYEEQELSEEELYNVLLALEQHDENPSELQSMLSPSLRAAFENALHSGQLQELVLEQWHPWWRPELVTKEEANNNFAVNKDQTLDERLLRITPFHSLRKDTRPNLLYNLIEILYSIVWTLRLYHGSRNAIALAVEATRTLSASTVLSEDARYTTLEEALIQCTAASTRLYPSGCNTPWTTLAQDVALLTMNSRQVVRALLEGIDLVKAAISVLKKESEEGYKNEVSNLRRVRKKLEFFMSWTREATELDESVGEEIHEWIDQWKNTDGDDGLDDLVLPVYSVGTSQQKRAPAKSQTLIGGQEEDALLVEVRTNRKVSELD
jgi:hypothetical protein